MNTCAERRFWDAWRNATNDGTCTLHSVAGAGHPQRRAVPIAIDGNGAATLATRSDFGCVQFEPKGARIHSENERIYPR